MENPFSAHNIRLDDGTTTNPSMGYTIDNHPHFQAARRLLIALYPDGLEGRTILDVGCLEGGYTVEFARLGMVATGIEVRDSNYQNCLYVKKRVNLPMLSFVKDDAMNLSNYGPVDALFVNGLLYHLDRPKRFLEAAAAVCRKVLFLQTHYAPTGPSPAIARYHLSELAENEGLLGRWYPEHDLAVGDELDRLKWTSWSNQRSFLICREHLLDTIKKVGFDVVLEQYDALDNILQDLTVGYTYQHSRSMFVGIKP